MKKADELLKIVGDDDWRKMLANLVSHLKAKQIIEMGGHEGWSTHAMGQVMSEDCTLYSVDIHPDWKMVGNYAGKVVLLGNDDTDMSIWERENVDLSLTDLWEIDSDHSYEHISKQWELYSPYFKPGCVVAIDDIDDNFTGVVKFWNELKADKAQINRQGIVVI